MKVLYLFILFPFIAVFAGAQSLLSSKVYLWEEMPETRSLPGKKKSILEGTTSLFSYLEVHATTLFAGNRRTPALHKHPDHEELLIVKEGVLDATLKGVKVKVPAGGIILVCPGDQHIISNGADKPSVYYIFRWRSRHFPPAEKANRQSVVIQWDEMKLIPSEKGGRRNILQRPTAQLNELEIHTTLLKEGLTSHAAHIHPDDEFILVKAGTVEETINGKSFTAGTGSLFFLSGKDNHGIRNAGKGECEYYAIRFK